MRSPLVACLSESFPSCRLHCFRIYGTEGRAAIESREFDEFVEYIGTAPNDDAPFFVFDTQDNLCPDITVDGVELEPNPVHSDVMKKVAKLHEELARFPETSPEAAPVPLDLHIQADRAKNIRIGLTDSKAYWTEYDEKMKHLTASEQPLYANYSFEDVKPCSSEALPDELRQALSSLASSSAASIALFNTRRFLRGSEPTAGTLPHAYLKHLASICTHRVVCNGEVQQTQACLGTD